MNRQDYLHYKSELMKKKNKPYMLTNTDMAAEFIDMLKEDNIHASVFLIRGLTYICITEKAEKETKKIVSKMIEDHKKQIQELETLLERM